MGMSEQNTQSEVTPSSPILGKSETPFEAAATMFGLYAPKFELLLKQLSTGQLRRLTNALVQYPLNDKEFINDSDTLKSAFSLGQTLLEAKWVMMMHSLMEEESKRLQRQTEGNETNEVKETTNG
jgi:hypothetical protein